MKVSDLKQCYIDSLSNYPFESEEEAVSIGLSKFNLNPKDTFTALESPFKFKTIHQKLKLENKKKTFIEEESSEGESTDNENAYYDDIEIELDLFVNNKLIVENSPICLIRNKKYGLVGRNGIGKTTLLKAIRKRKSSI